MLSSFPLKEADVVKHYTRREKPERQLKHLHCFEDRGMLGGVCAGIAYWFGLPTWTVRLLFIVTAWFFAVSILVYLALWFLVPEADKLPKDYAARTGDHS